MKSKKHPSVPIVRCIYPAEVFVNQDSSFAHETRCSYNDLNCAILPSPEATVIPAKRNSIHQDFYQVTGLFFH